MPPLHKQPAHYITLGTKRHPIIIRKHPRAKNLVVRFDTRSGEVRLTVPRYVSAKAALLFVESRRDWLEKRKHEAPPTVALVSGAVIPLMGKDYTLVFVGGRGVVYQDEASIFIPGAEIFQARRVKEYVQKQLMLEIKRLMALHPSAIPSHKKIKISLRDTRSRWGSCSKSGGLSFSWRLAFAPPMVLHYVVSHELAHLTHLNHSAKFWQHLATLHPAIDQAEHWLKTQGHGLWRYG